MYKLLVVAAVAIGCCWGNTFLIKSTDGGKSWIDIDPGPPHLELLDLQVTADGSRLYALTATRLEKNPDDRRRDVSVLTSSDGGRNWRPLAGLSVPSGFAAMAASPSDAGTVYVTRFDGWDDIAKITLLRTTDGGATTEELHSVTEALRPFNTYPSWCKEAPEYFGLHPAVPATLYMAFSCIGDNIDPYHAFLLSRDGGSTWSAQGLGWLNALVMRKLEANVTQLLGNSNEPLLIYSRNKDSAGKFHLAMSRDGGGTWSPPLLRDVAVAALDPLSTAILLASKNDGTLWMSSDYAENWNQLDTWLPFDRLIMYPKRSAVMAQAAPLLHQRPGTGEIMRSTDGGFSWSMVPTGLDGFSFVFDPSNQNIVYGMAQKRLQPRLRAPFVRNIAGGSALSPGSLFSAFGDDLAGGVTFDGEPAELSFVSRRQVNGRVPPGLKPGVVTLEVLVERGGATTVDRQTSILSESAPVILPDAPLLHADGLRPVSDVDPARPGERILIHATGLGPSPFVQIWPMVRPFDVYGILSVTELVDRPGVYEVAMDLPRELDEGSHLLLFWGGRNSARLPVRR